jgi:hypothetical protein
VFLGQEASLELVINQAVLSISSRPPTAVGSSTVASESTRPLRGSDTRMPESSLDGSQFDRIDETVLPIGVARLQAMPERFNRKIIAHDAGFGRNKLM